MSTESATTRRTGGLGIRWHHLVFALAFGVGAGILPPDGVVTPVGWLGGFLGSLTTAFVIAGLVLVVTRQVDDWRPGDLTGHETPDSGVKYVLLSAVSAQLFVLGTALTADVSLGTMLLLVSAVNPVVALAVLGDILRLQGRGIEWDRTEFAFPVAALLLGIVGGLAYWYRRGRKRTAWIDADTAAPAGSTEADERSTDADESTSVDASDGAVTADGSDTDGSEGSSEDATGGVSEDED